MYYYDIHVRIQRLRIFFFFFFSLKTAVADITSTTTARVEDETTSPRPLFVRPEPQVRFDPCLYLIIIILICCWPCILNTTQAGVQPYGDNVISKTIKRSEFQPILVYLTHLTFTIDYVILILWVSAYYFCIWRALQFLILLCFCLFGKRLLNCLITRLDLLA